MSALIIEKTKLCCTCKESKYLFSFSSNKSTKDGLQKSCKECVNTRKKNKGKAYRDSKANDFDYRLRSLMHAAKARALQKNREFTLTLKQLKELFPKDGCCPVFGFTLEWNTSGFRETSPSLDRIDSSKGYTKENVQIISWRANRLKLDATVSELELLLNYMKQGT